MQTKEVIEALKKAREVSNKRNFNQSVDLVITFKNLDLKKPDNQVDVFASLHYDRGKKIKICALIGPELKAQASVCEKVVMADEFPKYVEDKKLLKNLSKEYDFFIAQANIMANVAKVFGRILGPKGKMPNPKAGCVVGPNANVKAVYDKLQKTIRVKVDKPYLQCIVGKEDGKDEEIADNIMTIYNTLIHNLPNEKQNIRNVFVKLTMGKNIKVGKEEEKAKKKEEKMKVEEKKEVKEKKEAKAEKKPEKKEEKPKKEKPKSTKDKVKDIVKKTDSFSKGKIPKAEDLV